MLDSKSHRLALLLVATCCLPGNVLAQDPPATEKTASETEPVVANKPKEDIKPNPNPYYLPVGTFLFRPELGITTAYDSNVFAQRTNEDDDKILVFEPNFLLKSNWEKHYLQFNVGGEFGRYNDNPIADYDDYWADVKGRYDFSEKTNFFGGLNHTRDHEERGTPAVVGTIPTTFNSDQAHGGVAHRFGDYKMRIGGTVEQLDFDDSGPINNDDRDREMRGLGVRLNYLYKPNREFFIQGIHDARDYRTALDDDLFNRDSQGHRLGLGLKGRYTNQIAAEAYVGQLYQDYQDSRYSDINTLDFNASLNYLTGPRSRINFALNRSLEETTLTNSSAYLYNTISFQATRQLSARNSVVATFSAGSADYQDVTREESIYDASFDWRHRLNPEFFLSLRYRLLVNDSTESALVNNAANPQYSPDYVRHQLMLTLNATLFDVKDSGFGASSLREPLKLSENTWDGLYLGGQLSHGSTHAHTFGIRGTAGTDDANFGHDDAGLGLFAGYGMSNGRWYFGLEGEMDQTKRSMYHSKNKPIARTFTFVEDRSTSLALRGGYKLVSGPLLYARLGKVSGVFDIDFQKNDEPLNAVSDQPTLEGDRYGVGADIPISNGMFLRMDYSYTDYKTYTADAVTTAEDFNPSSNVFHLGLGWQLGGSGSNANKNYSVNLNGLYAGVQLGHGSINSHTSGIHNDSGSLPGTYDFAGDFGNNDGITGSLFAGFGRSFKRWYLGLEAEIEGSTAKWQHFRDPEGRDFGVEKKSGVSVGLRGGYQLRNGTLLYLAGSTVRSRFVTTWEKGGNTLNFVNRDDKMSGFRIAVGSDIPLSRSTFLRASYAVTDYTPYSYTTSHANADTMTFNNVDTLFRLGLGVRF
jgi:opacity protein-like surface antigen